MFVIDAVLDLLPLLKTVPKWTYIGCASFEPRCVGFTDKVHEAGLTPTSSLVLYPKDTFSNWQDECEKLQDSFWKTMHGYGWPNTARVDVAPLESAAWDDAREALDAVLEGDTDAGQHVILDVTTMPRVCFVPLLADLLQNEDVATLAVVYAEPQSYFDGELRSEPTQPTAIPPFVYAAGARRTEVAWIPILGFNPNFASSIYATLADSYDLRNRIYPMISFPAYEPKFFDRVIRETARSVLKEMGGADHARDHFVYCSAKSPFECREQILSLVRAADSTIKWIGSPMGPKPMAVGMVLAALEQDITIWVAQARSYHPEYSSGVARIGAYLLKRDSKKTYS